MSVAEVGLLSAFFVQWARARKNVPEWFTLLFQVLIGVGCYYWQYHRMDTQAVQWVLVSLGITQGASSLANLGLAVIPKTNSQ